MKHQPLLIGLTALLSVAFVAQASAAAPTVPSARYNKKIYYRVTSVNAAQNTGNKVCALLGKTCIGYTAVNTTAVCSILHPTAKKLTSVNGSKSGFYCDGAPQTGLACAKFKNTCEVCPACNVNADCGSDISGLFREMYVECGGPLPPPGKSSSSSAVSRPTAYGAPTLPSSKSNTNAIGPFPGNIACDFYQTKLKKVTCGAYKAADTFCTTAMQSRFAYASECNDKGRVVCVKPCVTNPKEVMPTRCAFDADRPSGSQAPPLNFCSTTSTQTFCMPRSSAAAPTQGTRGPGDICKTGADCRTGTYCIGTGRPTGSDLQQCSCSQFSLTFNCK